MTQVPFDPYNPYGQAPPWQPPQAPPAYTPPPNVPPPIPATDDYLSAFRQAGMSDKEAAERLEAFARVNAAQTPQEYMQAAHQAGLTGQAFDAAAGQVARGVPAGPVAAPTFEEQLAEYQQRNAALEAQLNAMNRQWTQQLAHLQQQLGYVQQSVPQRVDPITESAGKVARAFADIPRSDARNILHSALRSHLVSLGLTDLAKLI